MSLSVDNIIGVQPTLTSSSNLQARQVDIYNGVVNFHRISSSATTPLLTITIPNASGTIVLDTASQTITNKIVAVQTGTITNCGLQFSSAANTGLVYVAPNKFNAVANGSSVATFSNTNTIFYGQVFVPVGTATQPAVGNSTATTTGLFFTATPTLGISVSGSQSVGFEVGGQRLYGSTAGNNALYSASLLGYYEEYPWDTTWGFLGGGATTSIACKITRIGRLIVVFIPCWDLVITNSSGVNRYCVSQVSIPIRFRQTSSSLTEVVARGSTGAAELTLNLTVAGGNDYLQIENVNGTSFANGATLNLYGTTISWTI